MFDVALVRKRFNILAWNSGTGEKTWNELSVVIWKENRYKSENNEECRKKITKTVESSQSRSFRACAPAQELETTTTMTENDKRN